MIAYISFARFYDDFCLPGAFFESLKSSNPVYTEISHPKLIPAAFGTVHRNKRIALQETYKDRSIVYLALTLQMVFLLNPVLCDGKMRVWNPLSE